MTNYRYDAHKMFKHSFGKGAHIEAALEARLKEHRRKMAGVPEELLVPGSNLWCDIAAHIFALALLEAIREPKPLAEVFDFPSPKNGQTLKPGLKDRLAEAGFSLTPPLDGKRHIPTSVVGELSAHFNDPELEKAHKDGERRLRRAISRIGIGVAEELKHCTCYSESDPGGCLVHQGGDRPPFKPPSS